MVRKELSGSPICVANEFLKGIIGKTIITDFVLFKLQWSSRSTWVQEKQNSYTIGSLSEGLVLNP